MYEFVPRPGCELWRRMKAASIGGKESVATLVDFSTRTLMPTDSICSWTATQSSGIGVGSGVGSGLSVADGSAEPDGSREGVGVARPTGVPVGSGIGGRLEAGRASRSSCPTIMRATPATARKSGSSMLDIERRMTRPSLATTDQDHP
jgi:hypothetical protein